MTSQVSKHIPTFLTLLMLLMSGLAFCSDVDVFLLMGQSNMEGRSYDSAAPKYENSEAILALNYDGRWRVASTPLHYRGVGPGLRFAERYVAHYPERTIGLVPLAVGGTEIKRWIKGGDLYAKTLKQVAKIEEGKIAGILWHQGESDTESEIQSLVYQTQLDSLINDIRTDLNQPNLPFIVGELGHWLYDYPGRSTQAKTINAVLKDTPSRIESTGFASADGLTNGDKWHFTVSDIRELGERYFEQYVQLLDSPN